MIFYYFFAEKIGEKIGVFDSKRANLYQKFDHSIGVWRKRRKLVKIGENCNHSIDPQSRVYQGLLTL
jgi:hypothetical protein